MATFLQDLRYASRILLRSPGFTIAALVALALGIGATSAIFSVVDAVLVRPLPFPAMDRLVMVFQTRPRGSEPEQMSPANYLDLREQSSSFTDLGAYSWWDVNLTGVEEPERIQGFLVSPGFFPALGVAPTLGRTFLPEEEQPGKDRVAVLSHRLFERRFAASPAVIGSKLVLNGVPHTVIGVMPPDFQYPPGSPEIWAPLTIDGNARAQRGAHSLKVVARLAPGVALGGAQAEMDRIARSLERAAPEANTGRGLIARPLIEDVVRYSAPALLSLFGGVAFVLLIACANVANLLLARGATRRKELAVRAAIGASRSRVFRQLLTESLLLSSLGGVLGLLVGVWGIELIHASLPRELVRFVPGWDAMGIDARKLAFTALVSILSGLLFGTLPALRSSRPDLNESLKNAPEKAHGGGRHRLRGSLVVSEVALALVMLVGAGLSIQGFRTLVATNLGVVPDHLLTAQVNLSDAAYGEPAKVTAFYRRLLEDLEHLPGVTLAGAVSSLPFGGNWEDRLLTVDGAPPASESERAIANVSAVSPRYFATVGIPIVAGRAFSEQDDENAQPVAIVSRKMVQRFWPGQDALGKRFKLGRAESKSAWRTVVGVVEDVRRFGLEPEGFPTFYLPYPQQGRQGMSLVLRTSVEPTVLATPLAAAVRRIDPGQPVFSVRTMEQVIADAISGPRLTMGLMGVLAFIALLLAGVGIYGVVSHAATERTREIGIRMALGAARGDVMRMVLRQGLAPVALGLGLGLCGAFVVSRALAGALFWMRPGDLLSFVGLPLLLAAIAIAATLVPARRATRIDPTTALRCE